MSVNKQLLENAEKAMLNIAEKLRDKIVGKDLTLEKLKSQTVVGDIKLNGKKVTGVTLPDSIIDDFVSKIAEKIDATTITEYKKDSWAVQIFNQIFNTLKPFQTVTKSGYTIKFSTDLVMEGVGTVSAEVTYGKYTATLSWQNINTKTLQGYFDALSALNKDVWKEFRSVLLRDSVKIFKALYGIGNTKITDVITDNKILKKVTTSEFLNYVKKLAPNDKELSNQIKAYENLSKKYAALKKATSSNFDSKAKDFLTACNNLEMDLGLSKTSLSDVYSLTLNETTKGKIIVPVFYKKYHW